MLEWDDLVAEGKKLASKDARVTQQKSDIMWAWADLAIKVCPVNRRGTLGSDNAKVAKKLREFIQATGCPYAYATMKRARQCAATWKPEEREPTSVFEAHRILVGHKHLMEPHMSCYKARRLRSVETPRSRPFITVDGLARIVSNRETLRELFEKHPEVKDTIIDALAVDMAPPLTARKPRLRSLIGV